MLHYCTYFELGGVHYGDYWFANHGPSASFWLVLVLARPGL